MDKNIFLNQKQTRYHVLDSLRGLASLQVVIGHCMVSLPALMLLIYPIKTPVKHDFMFYISHSPLVFFWSATPAVKVFFVLSGFVLALPYFNELNNKPNYLKFVVKRIIRLYLPCLAIILISVLLKYLLFSPGSISMFSEWITKIWTRPENLFEWVNRLLLNNEVNNLNPALWTLPVEIILSLILPIFIYFIKKLNNTWSFIAVIFFTPLYHISLRVGLNHISESAHLFYFTFFLWGMLICKHRKEIKEWVDGLPKYFFLLLLISSIVIYTSNVTLWWLPTKIFNLLNRYDDYTSGIAAILFIILSLGKQSYRLLNNKYLIFIGKISFSLYLIHPVVIVSMAYILSAVLNEYLIVCLAFIVSLLMSVLFYKYIEMPSLEIAKLVAGYFFKEDKNTSQVIVAEKQ